MTDAEHRLASAALRNWGIVDYVPKLLKQRENYVYAVHTTKGTSAVLRVHRQHYHSEASLRSELQWLAHLHEAGLAVPRPIADLRGELLVRQTSDEIPEPRSVDMLSWVPGKVLGESGVSLPWPTAELRRIFFALGAAMAELHKTSDDWRVPRGFVRHAWDSEGLLGETPFWGRFWENEALDSGQRDMLRRARSLLRDELARYTEAGGDYGLIHADLIRENVLVSPDSIALIDFDDGGFGWRLFDLATALIRNRAEPSYALIETALIDGYRSCRNLTDADLEKLPMFMLLRSCTYLGWIRTRSDVPGGREKTQRFIAECCALTEDYLRDWNKARPV